MSTQRSLGRPTRSGEGLRAGGPRAFSQAQSDPVGAMPHGRSSLFLKISAVFENFTFYFLATLGSA